MKMLLLAALAVAAADRTVVTQTACVGLDGRSVETAKKELLLAARRGAVEQLFGSQVTSVTEVADLALQTDQIQAATVGYVHLQGDPTFFNGQGLGELCVTLQAFTTDEDRAAVDRTLRDLAAALRTPRPTWRLDADLDRLGLGARIVAAVVATPPEALAGARCAWTVEPADVLKVPPPDGACRLEVAMPGAPLPGRGTSVPARIAVRIEREGQLLDELAVRGTVHNSLAVEPVTSASVLPPGASVHVKIVPRGRSGPLPPGTVCAWSLQPLPLVFTPSSDDGCEGSLALKPEDTWSPQEGMIYASELKSQLPLTVTVRLSRNGTLISGAAAVVELATRDERDPDELMRRFILLISHPRRGSERQGPDSGRRETEDGRRAEAGA